MEKIICLACKNESTQSVDNCIKCDFPFNGSEQEKSKHIGQFIMKKGVVYDTDESLGRSKKIISIIALFNTIFLIFGLYNGQIDILNIILNLIVIFIFIWCAITIKKNPFEKTLIPLILFISIIILNFIINPNTLFQGILWKIIFIGSLSYSMYLVKSTEKFREKFNK
ncbi:MULTISPECIES: hypothetical protein [Tenacibaculum]|uniref:hypothetical protein n=1 Tax=Tenacibaculum TaxID=104267 RepID=UPI001F0A3C77|nr:MULTISPECIES: hypothetical protein [Tenacibaculum]MCH3882854.1 hypothetical protein [Tenacibaculum aquimarinum]MDO6600437.1 hypothetical protein [Tenacibaculum sp. 1_MG-2023]